LVIEILKDKEIGLIGLIGPRAVSERVKGNFIVGQGDCYDQVHSYQIVFGTGRWEARPRTRRPKALKAKLTQGGPSGLSLLRSDDFYEVTAKKKVQLTLSRGKKKKGDEVEDEDDEDVVRISVSQDRVTVTLCNVELFLCAQYICSSPKI
jgi:hypothetical protein